MNALFPAGESPDQLLTASDCMPFIAVLGSWGTWEAMAMQGTHDPLSPVGVASVANKSKLIGEELISDSHGSPHCSHLP